MDLKNLLEYETVESVQATLNKHELGHRIHAVFRRARGGENLNSTGLIIELFKFFIIK